jgi:hypothetical protein
MVTDLFEEELEEILGRMWMEYLRVDGNRPSDICYEDFFRVMDSKNGILHLEWSRDITENDFVDSIQMATSEDGYYEGFFFEASLRGCPIHVDVSVITTEIVDDGIDIDSICYQINVDYGSNLQEEEVSILLDDIIKSCPDKNIKVRYRADLNTQEIDQMISHNESIWAAMGPLL